MRSARWKNQIRFSIKFTPNSPSSGPWSAKLCDLYLPQKSVTLRRNLMNLVVVSTECDISKTKSPTYPKSKWGEILRLCILHKRTTRMMMMIQIKALGIDKSEYIRDSREPWANCPISRSKWGFVVAKVHREIKRAKKKKKYIISCIEKTSWEGKPKLLQRTTRRFLKRRRATEHLPVQHYVQKKCQLRRVKIRVSTKNGPISRKYNIHLRLIYLETLVPIDRSIDHLGGFLCYCAAVVLSLLS